MGTLHMVALAAAVLSIHALPQATLPERTTIFGDERLEGGIFEHVDDFNNIRLYSSDDNPYRLPTTTKPEHYDLLWMVNIPELSFSGEVNIQLYATQPDVSEIVIHAHDLNVTRVTLYQGDQEVTLRDYIFEPYYHFLRIRILNGVLSYNAAERIMYTLSIAFEAPLRNDMTGMYRNWFRNNATGEVSWMASTHFQATAARFAFPCYDEPNLKATFDVVIRRPSGFGSWFCTLKNFTRSSNFIGYEEDVFTRTPVMPTYLLAMIVAEYTSSTYEVDGVLRYEVIARPSAIATGQHEYAFYTGQELLEEMSNHTAFDFYSLSPNLKMTQAAIPDFRAGAMENWGLLVYRESNILHHPNDTNRHFQQLIATIVSHEIAHMWFGNLVTCDWWDNFWLNEGFARYYQYFLTDWVKDFMGLERRFVNEQVHTALLADSANNPHPLTNPGIGDPVAIRTMFSTLSYNKGACLIRMTEHLIGFAANREGLRNYLVDRQYSTALPIHLFQALQDAAVAANTISEYGPTFNVIEYYRTWTEQGGHPVLNVQVDHQTGMITINQRRFNINSGYGLSTFNWIVPVTFATAEDPDFENTKPTHIINSTEYRIDRGSIGDQWVIFNKQQTGFYRVNYDDYTWHLIVTALRGPERIIIHEANRAQIIDDVFQFARSGIMDYKKALSIVEFLENETEYTPWLAAITGLNWIRNRLAGTSQLADLESVIARWSAMVMRTVGYTPAANEDFMSSYFRYQLAPFVCNLNVQECRDAAESQFRDLVDNGQEVPLDNRNWVYCNALRNGTVEDFDFLWERFLGHNVYSEKVLLLQNLGCTPHEESLFKFLRAIVEDNFEIRAQDYTTAFNSAVNSNEGNTQIVFRFIQQNMNNVSKAFDSLATPLASVSARLRTEQELVEFEQWADDNRLALGSEYLTVRNGAQSTRNSINWRNSVLPDIQAYLDLVDQSAVTTPSTESPVDPDLPDSANTAFLSAFTVILALIANFVVRH